MTGNGNLTIPPMKMVIWVMVYYCLNHIIVPMFDHLIWPTLSMRGGCHQFISHITSVFSKVIWGQSHDMVPGPDKLTQKWNAVGAWA